MASAKAVESRTAGAMIPRKYPWAVPLAAGHPWGILPIVPGRLPSAPKKRLSDA